VKELTGRDKNEGMEITIELDPGTFDAEKLEKLSSIATRVSMGV